MKDIVAALKLLFVLALSLRSKNGTGSLFWGEEEEVTASLGNGECGDGEEDLLWCVGCEERRLLRGG